ncbi:MAG: hypothetical protein ACK40Y_04360 [Cloacibacterium caeni]
MKYANIREEEIKIKVRDDFFSEYDYKILGNIDFCITPKNKNPKQTQLFDDINLLWAEAKTGDYDVISMFAQLILTIGKARTFDKTLPPAFLGAFDGKKIAFIPYNAVLDIFSLNDFNWNVTSSNQNTKEFAIIRERVQKSLDKNDYLYDFLKDEKELKFFIKNNLAKATESGKILINKNNFVPIYLRWVEQVKPYIDFDWEDGKKQNILDNSFFLADLFVDDKGTSVIEDDTPISENLFVVFKNGHYEIAKENLKSLFNATIPFKDKKPYEQFWKKYKRPPLEEFQKYILERKDLLVPQDIRERKGAYFTPRIWVELSQKYIADVLGEDWQEEYYVWDCAAGTGNLLAGLTNKYHIFASTLDQSDVNAMHERIENGALLLHDYVFQFDFLNDEFLPKSKGGKLPDDLYNIITDEEKRKKLVVYINPPYAEGDNVRGIGRKNVHISKTHDKYQKELGKASGELFAQFFIRIYKEIPNCVLAEFSKLKILQAPNFSDFREVFRAKLEKLFVVPAKTFDNVTGEFPIGFFIWNLGLNETFDKINSDVFDKNGNFIQTKYINSYDGLKYISNWLEINSKNISKNHIGHMSSVGNDFQNQRMVFIDDVNAKRKNGGRHTMISVENLIIVSIYFAVRHCIEATWLNDRDQFLFPNDKWKSDSDFQNDCLAFTLFSNNIQSQFGTNHWIPFTELEVNARSKFESNFMTDFINGKVKIENEPQDLFSQEKSKKESQKLEFSEEATAVFDAGRNLWKYYHSQPNVNVNASLYDIREHFQGRNEKGKMNNKSEDENYMKLITELRSALKILAKKIEPKVYEYGFLKE